MQKNKRGFSLLELLIVVAVIGILVTLVFPFLIRSRVNANESATKANLKTFSSAMESYRAAQNPPAYPVNFGNLTSAFPEYINSTWGSGTTTTKSGYDITYVRASSERYATYAEPNQVSITGNASFCVDETGIVWTSITASGAFTASPCSGGTGATVLQ